MTKEGFLVHVPLSHISRNILEVTSADEFYSAMGQLSREMLELSNADSNRLIKVSFNETIQIPMANHFCFVSGSGRNVALPLHRGVRAAGEVHLQHHSLVTRHRRRKEGAQDPLQVSWFAETILVDMLLVMGSWLGASLQFVDVVP